MIGLLRLLRAHAGAVEADLLRFYGVDLLDFWRGRLSPRRLAVLVRGIPAGQGAATRSLDGPEVTPERWILSDVWRWLVQVHGDGHKDPGPHPILVPPSDDEDDGVSDAALDAWERRKAERAEMLAREG